MMAISIFAMVVGAIGFIVAVSCLVAWLVAAPASGDALPGIIDLSGMNAKQLDGTIATFTALLKAGTITSGQADVLRLAKSYRATLAELTSETETKEP